MRYSRQASIGGVLWDNSGKVLCYFSVNIGTQDAVTAEILAIAKACELCLSKTDLTSRRLVINSDSKAAVSWINSNDLGNIRFTHLFYEIRNSLFLLRQATVQFSSRSTNFFADFLAKKGSSSEGEVIVWSL